MTKFESYIINNRSELDSVEAPNDPGKIWERIQKQTKIEVVPSTSGLKLHKYVQWAIAASFGLLIGLGLYPLRPQTAAEIAPDLKVAAIFPEFKAYEEHYSVQIAKKELEIGLNSVDEKEFSEIFSEMELLEQLKQEYIDEAKKVPLNDQLIETLIRFYEKRIRLLERLHKEIEKQKYHDERIQDKLL